MRKEEEDILKCKALIIKACTVLMLFTVAVFIIGVIAAICFMPIWG